VKTLDETIAVEAAVARDAVTKRETLESKVIELERVSAALDPELHRAAKAQIPGLTAALALARIRERRARQALDAARANARREILEQATAERTKLVRKTDRAFAAAESANAELAMFEDRLVETLDGESAAGGRASRALDFSPWRQTMRDMGLLS